MTDTIMLDRNARAQIRTVLTGAGTDKTRPVLTGAYFDDGEHLVTTDSYRLHALALDTPLTGLNLSAKDLKRALTTRRINDEVTLTRDGDVVKAVGGKHPMALTAIQGAFPRWRELLPSEAQATITVDLDDDFLGMLKRVHAISEGRTGTIPARLTREGDKLWVRAGSHRAEFSEWMPAEFSGDVPEIAFNPRFLADFAAFGSVAGRVTLHLRDQLKPALIRTPTRTGLLMPVRL